MKRDGGAAEATAGSPLRVVVMGVASSGKTTVAQAMAQQLGAIYLDADDFHPAGNVAKMSAGTPLTDTDRWPWLARLREQLRTYDRVVLACSALRRSYRDDLRGADHVTFVFLDVDATTAGRRAEHRSGHFMGAGMVASQFETLERPGPAEHDVVTVDATRDEESVVTAAIDAFTAERANARPLLAVGDRQRHIQPDELGRHLRHVADLIEQRAPRRVLLVPPDHTRRHSRAGEATVALRTELAERGIEVGVLPALGTHAPMGDADAHVLFGGALSGPDLIVHDWRHRLRRLGEISADEVAVITSGRNAQPVEIAVDEELFDRWDLVVSIGQVVPHEVIGMANFTKNIVIGLGGAPTINRTHFVGAVCDMESIMGRAVTPVRDLVDRAFDRFIAPLVDVMWVLTVVEDIGERTELRGLFVGEGRVGESGGAAFRAAARLAREVNVAAIEQPLDRVVCWLDPLEFRSTWLGNKAVYRTRMAIADGGELIVLAPGVARFGEDERIDRLIRRHGYRGTPATLAALDSDPELASNLSAAAHLIHGSSEGRFRIVYCTDPEADGLTRAEVESVGYGWRNLAGELDRLGLAPPASSGRLVDRAGSPYTYIANPALGLWMVRPR